MGKDKKLKGKQPKVDSKGNPSAAEIEEGNQARSAASLEIARKQPAHPPPLKTAPPSASFPLVKLVKEHKKKKDPKERKISVDKNSPPSESSEEPVLDTNLNLIKEEKEEKKTAEVNTGTSPSISRPNCFDF